MKLKNSLLATIIIFTSSFATIPVKADTVEARCDVYPKGEDQATSSGLCTFSQRQGAVGIQLENGQRYDLRPTGNRPGNYLDQNGRAAYRQSGMGNRGQIYQLSGKSIYVYWDTAPYGQKDENVTAANNHPDAGSNVPELSSLVEARAGQAENMLKQKGYTFVSSSRSGDAIYSYWLEAQRDYCVTIRTEQGRYQSIVYATPFDCGLNSVITPQVNAPAIINS